MASRVGYVFLVVIVAGLALVYSQMDDFGYLKGTVDLRDGSALTFQANGDDTLRFPAFVTAEGTDSAALQQSLASSTLHVRIAGPSGGEIDLTCPLWESSVSSEASGARITESRIANDCAYDVTTSGDYTVRASVDWAPGLAIVEAHLEIRDELADD